MISCKLSSGEGIKMTTYDLRFKNNFTMIVCGPSFSGKTDLCFRIMELQERLYEKPPGNVYYCYKLFQPKFAAKKHLVHEYIEGLPDLPKLRAISEQSPNSTVYIDDLAPEADKETAEMFTVASHHLGINFVFVQHTIFSKNPVFREMALNATYMVLFKNPRDSSSFATLARQFSPERWRALTAAYKTATETPYSYFFMDWNQVTPEKIRFRSNVLFEEEEAIRVYLV
jgi:hypothetical protein